MRTHPSVTRRGVREGEGLRSRLTCIEDGTERGVDVEGVERSACTSWIEDDSSALSDVEDGGGWPGAAAPGGITLRRLGIGIRGVTVFSLEGRLRSVSRMSDADARDFEELLMEVEFGGVTALVWPGVGIVLSFESIRVAPEGSRTTAVGDSRGR